MFYIKYREFPKHLEYILRRCQITARIDVDAPSKYNASTDVTYVDRGPNKRIETEKVCKYTKTPEQCAADHISEVVW